MKLRDSWARIIRQDIIGNYVFSVQDLRVLFWEDSDRGFQATLARLMEAEALKRAVRGIYWNPTSRNWDGTTLERIAGTMRRNHLCYISLESILSAHSIISQQTMDTITVMTTGKGGWYLIDGLGAIEFTHTKKNPGIIRDNLLYGTNFLPHATAQLAYEELKRVGRNMDLVDMVLLEEIIDEQNTKRFSRSSRPHCDWNGTYNKPTHRRERNPAL